MKTLKYLKNCLEKCHVVSQHKIIIYSSFQICHKYVVLYCNIYMYNIYIYMHYLVTTYNLSVRM